MPTIMVNVTKTKYDTAMIVGARPNFVKVAPLLNKFEENNLNVLFIPVSYTHLTLPTT